MNNITRKLTVNFVIATTLAVIFGTAMTSINRVWAEPPIHCPTVAGTNQCNGTDGADKMLGTNEEDVMNGRNGQDEMFGSASDDEMFGNNAADTMKGDSGDDSMHGNERNDNVNGGSSNDIVRGGFGEDILKGNSGNDKIYHSDVSQPLQADNSKDDIDCGSGNDEAWINVSTDHDTADSNCETIHQR